MYIRRVGAIGVAPAVLCLALFEAAVSGGSAFRDDFTVVSRFKQGIFELDLTFFELVIY